jgi:NADPH2:quinone reductase
MRAAWYDSNGPAREVLRVSELPDPLPGPGEVRVRIATSGLNPSDVKRRGGFGGQRTGGRRIVPNSDGAGVVDALGAGVTRVRPGDRVWLWNAQWQRDEGTCASLCCVPETLVAPLPMAADFATGACLGIPAMTAHQAVCGRGEVRGRTLLVTGGAGAVGLCAIQVAKWAGARVIATVSSAAKAAIATAAGADAVVDYRGENAAERILALTDGDGVDRIVEVDFGANLATSLAVLKPNGAIAAYASMSVPTPQLPYYPLMMRGIGIELVFVYLMPAAARERALADIGAMLDERALRPAIGARFALDAVVAAHEAQESGQVVGNIVIDVAALD